MFNYTVKGIRKKNGQFCKVILVTGNNVDSTIDYKEELKGFGASWIGMFKSWGWFASDDPKKNQIILDKMVKPAIMFLSEKEADKNPNSLVDIIDMVLDLLDTSDSQEEIDSQMNVFLSKEEIKQKLEEYKTDLVNTMNEDSFKQMIEPMLLAWQNTGYEFSLLNTILIKIQDPSATVVKNAKDWGHKPYYRVVNPNSPAIGLFVPVGGKPLFKGREAKRREKLRWMAEHGYRSEEEITGGDIEKLKKHLNQTYGHTGYDIKYYFYDVRFTTVIKGKEGEAVDLGNGNIDVPWYNDNGKETLAVKEKIDSTLQVVAESGVDVSKQPNLRGALGVSKGGKIEVLDKAKMNSNYLLTILHEFAHEILHQRYLKDNNPEYAQFYFGRPEGTKFVEQQAELTGWLVCRVYGYNIRESVNYAALWGMTDAKKAVHAFDTVANVASYLVDKINKKIIENRMEDEQAMIGEATDVAGHVKFTGYQVAQMVGAGDLYKRGLEQIAQEEQMKSEAVLKFVSMTNKINECDKKRLQDILD